MPQVGSFTRLMVALVVGGSMLGLSACAPEPASTPEPTPTAVPESPAPEAYDGPLHFIGDELDWFLLSADEIAEVVPGSSDFAEPSASLLQISDGGGPEPEPAICSALMAEASLGSIGARSLTWRAENDQDGRLLVLQFANTEQAERRMDDYIAAAAQCGEFAYGQSTSTFDSVVIDEDGVRSVAGALVIGDPASAWRHYFGIASVGNVLVEFWHSFTGESAIDAESAARALHARATQARQSLVDDLSAHPPVPPSEQPAADASAPWSEWAIGFEGIGPLRLGGDIDEVVATVPDADVSAPERAPDPRTLTSPDGSASVEVAAEEEGTAVATIRTGRISQYGEPPIDGAGLPRAEGVGVGDPIESAVAAFPEGTSVRVVAAGLFFYEVSTREGRMLLFHTDHDIAEPGATIIGITAEDATLRREYYFGAHLE